LKALTKNRLNIYLFVSMGVYFPIKMAIFAPEKALVSGKMVI